MSALLARLIAMGRWPLIGSAALAAALGWWAGGAHQHRAGFEAGNAACEADHRAAVNAARLRHRDIAEEARNAVDDTERNLADDGDLERLCASESACPDR